MAAPASDWLRHFQLLLLNHWMEFNKTWQEAKPQRPLPSFFYCHADRNNKMAAPASDWLRQFRLLLFNRWTESTQLDTEVISQRPLRLWFSGRSEYQDICPGLRFLTVTFSTWMKFNETWQEGRSQDTVLNQICVFGLIRKTIWPSWIFRKQSLQKCIQVHEMSLLGPMHFCSSA